MADPNTTVRGKGPLTDDEMRTIANCLGNGHTLYMRVVEVNLDLITVLSGTTKLMSVNSQWQELSDAQKRSLESFRKEVPELRAKLEIAREGLRNVRDEQIVSANTPREEDENSLTAAMRNIATEALAKLEEK